MVAHQKIPNADISTPLSIAAQENKGNHDFLGTNLTRCSQKYDPKTTIKPLSEQSLTFFSDVHTWLDPAVRPAGNHFRYALSSGPSVDLTPKFCASFGW
jgi:hypothetical protein